MKHTTNVETNETANMETNMSATAETQTNVSTAPEARVFRFGRGKSARAGALSMTELTAEEHATVNKHLEAILGYGTKQSAIEFLYDRGWPTKAICEKIRYEDGRELTPQHVNGVIGKLREKRTAQAAEAAKATTAALAAAGVKVQEVGPSE